MSDMPMTDAVKAQFDEWDQEIDEIKKEVGDAAKEKLKKLAKSIEEWIKSKNAELNKNKEKQEQSPLMKSLKKIEDISKKIMKGIGDVIEVVKSIIEVILDILKFLMELLVDTTMAITTIATRGPKTVMRCVTP